MPSQVVLVAKKPPANAGDIREVGLIPGSGRSPGGGNGTPSSILVWRMPWTEEPGRLQSMRLQTHAQSNQSITLHPLFLQENDSLPESQFMHFG